VVRGLFHLAISLKKRKKLSFNPLFIEKSTSIMLTEAWDKLDYKLSAPILEHLAELGFQKMTPVQVSLASCFHF
jgi:superfamily II DNA/RNA helicase